MCVCVFLIYICFLLNCSFLLLAALPVLLSLATL